jgi:hypothetical protein
MEKYQARQVLAEVCKVLWEQWDPIGVNDTPQALGEYDSYAGGVYSLLLRGASDAEVAQHLRRVETENMGLRGSSKEHLTLVVGALRAIDLEPQEAP